MPLPVDYPIIDADGHVVEIDDEIKQYLPARYHQIPDNREYGLFPMEGWSFGTTDRHKQDVPTAADWLGFLAEAGIAATVLYPSNALNHGLMRHTAWAVDVARAYNDWLHDRFTRHSPRLNGVALLPLQDVDAAVAELRRCARDYGFVGGYVTTVTSPLTALGDPAFDPLYAAAQELDVMLAVHGGAVGGHTFAEPLLKWREVRAVKHVIPQLIQVTSMISSGDANRDGRARFKSQGCGQSGISRCETVKPVSPAFGLEPRPTAPSSRISPPDPVAAPANGAIAVGWLCVSTLISQFTDSVT